MTVSSRSQHRCTRTYPATGYCLYRGDVCARIGENHVSWNVLCLGMSSSIHLLTQSRSLTSAWMYMCVGRSVCMRPLRSPVVVRLVFCLCLDVLCYMFKYTSHSPLMFTHLSVDVWVARLRTVASSHRLGG